MIYEFVAEEFGFILDEARIGFLTSKLIPRLTELRLESFSDYYAHLKFSPHFCEEHKKLLSLITNNETYFFREEAQLNILTSHVLPELKEKKSRSRDKKIRIISAGCSSGEEAYTLAMILRQQLPQLFPGVTFYFLPADIVSQILNFGLPAPIDIQVVGRNIQANRTFALDLFGKLKQVALNPFAPNYLVSMMARN